MVFCRLNLNVDPYDRHGARDQTMAALQTDIDKTFKAAKSHSSFNLQYINKGSCFLKREVRELKGLEKQN